MSTLRLATAANVRAFQVLVDALTASDSEWREGIDGDALEDEVGRFRVWAGNLGALQKGHSSLDYRLRDSPNLLSSALKLLNELEHNLNETYAVVSGARLPYEAQTSTNEAEEDENDDGFFSEDDSDSDEPKNELKMRFEELVDIIDNLYKLSVRIRTPSIRSRSLKASAYMPTDPDTGVDVLGAYAELDRKHVQELLSQLRQPHPSEVREEQDLLIERLSSSITLRRRHFKYWKRHRDKLGASAIFEEALEPRISSSYEAPNPVRNDSLEAHPTVPIITTLIPTPSQKTGRTLLSGTEATHHHQSLDDIVDTKSVTSYAVTVRDLHGKGIDLPPPPKAANGDKDFECPYCWIVCPARYGKGRAWKTHLLQDLQPYICTYQDCEASQQLFRSRREWAEHEATHRKLWRCPEHSDDFYMSHSGLENHLRQDHNGSFPEDQIAIIAKIGETTAMDARARCPICHAPVDTEGLGDLQNHIAHHLERFATFALPHGMEDDSDGASSVASRGSSNSQSLSDSVSIDTSNDAVIVEERDIKQSSGLLHMAEPGQGLLSAESLQQLPDESQNRLARISGQLDDQDNSEDEQSDDQQLDEDILPSHKEHLDEQEAFRKHILTLPGVLSVRFYRRYGSWTGSIIFANDLIGEEALAVFDAQRFPNIEFQSKKDKSKWKFSRTSGTTRKDNWFSRQSTADTQISEDVDIISSGSELYDDKDHESSKQAIISTAEIPTLRSLYQSRRLLQRDQSFAPNDTYNQMISFCHYDLTRLRVDAIVSNAPVNFKTTPTPGSLHHAIFKAGGPGLREEARSKARVKAGLVELTHGHDLPSSWVIHAAAPTYTGSKGVGQFNILSGCYRSALKMAATYEFKTIAFPCLGTGGSSFPPRVAARIALQEVREYLDLHPEHRPERIVFCVRSAIDEKAYTDFLPVFFPPTHGDLDRARTSDWSANRAALSAQILEARSQLQKALSDMSDTYVFRSETTSCSYDMRRVDSALTSIRNYLLGSKELKRSLGDLNLLCSVVITACTSISEIAERAKEMGFAKESQSLWNETNTAMQAKHGFELSTLFDYCWMFANSLDDVLTRDTKEPDSMARARQVLENYGVKQKGQDAEGIRDHLDEVIHVRQSERPAGVKRDVIPVHQIPSVARLYQLGELEAKPTMASPSTSFNNVVCLLRDDITRLGVDVMVNSTDVSFSGMGTLDRSVFKKGGPELHEDVKLLGKCEEGDVKMTRGHVLPAKYILHVVPPEQFRKDTKNVLRNCYRAILHTAEELKATSVAIPSIGTGMLNYPRRDCASLAMEEVKRFLESAEPGNGINKIIFVVFSSNDEFIYRSLLPVYFPPTKGKEPEEPQSEEQTPAQNQATKKVVDYMRREAEQEKRESELRESNAQEASPRTAVPQYSQTQESLSNARPRIDAAAMMAGSSSDDDSYHSNSSQVLERGFPRMQRQEYDQRSMFEAYEAALQRHELTRTLIDDQPVATNPAASSDLVTPFDLSREDRLLLQLKEDEKMPWEDIAARFLTDFYKGYSIPALQKHLERLKDRSHFKLDEEERLLLRLREDERMPWKDVAARFETHFNKKYQIPKLQMRLKLLRERMPRSRFMNSDEEYASFKFESHVDDCYVCSDGLFERTYKLCEQGYPLAQTILQHMEMSADANIDSKTDGAILVVPTDSLPSFMLLLSTVAKDSETGKLLGPFIRVNKPHLQDVGENPQDDPAMKRVKVLSPFQSQGRDTLGHTWIRVAQNKIVMYPEHEVSGPGVPITSIDLTGAFAQIIPGNERNVSLWTEHPYIASELPWEFHSAEPADAVALLELFQSAIENGRQKPEKDVSPEREEATDSASAIASGSKTEKSAETTDAEPYQRWTHGLRDTKDYIDYKHHNEGQTDSQSAVHFSEDTMPLTSGESIEVEQRMRRFKLRVQILDYLAKDFECRPGSYIGQSTENIAAENGIDTELATSLLRELVEQERVHNTVNDDTWVISQQSGEVSAVEQDQQSKDSSNTDLDALAEQALLHLSRTGVQPSTVKHSWSVKNKLRRDRLIDITDGGDTLILTDLGKKKVLEIQAKLAQAEQKTSQSVGPGEGSPNDLSERALSYLRSLPGMSENIWYLATTFDTPVAELQTVLEKLESDGLVESKDNAASWTAKIPSDDKPTVPSHPPFSSFAATRDGQSFQSQSPHLPELNLTLATPHASPTPSVRSPSPAIEPRDDEPDRARSRVNWGENRFHHFDVPTPKSYPEQLHDRGAPKQEHSVTETPESLETGKASSWKDGRGAKERKQTRSSRTLAKDIEEDLESGTAKGLRLAKIARETKYNKSNRAAADDIDDELEYYDGQEEDYVEEEEDKPER